MPSQPITKLVYAIDLDRNIRGTDKETAATIKEAREKFEGFAIFEKEDGGDVVVNTLYIVELEQTQ